MEVQSDLSLLSALRALPAEPTSKPFSFVTVTDPADIRNRSTQRKIRRHAGLSRVRRQSKKTRPTTWSFELNTISTGVSSTPSLEIVELDHSQPRHASSTTVSRGQLHTEHSDSVKDQGYYCSPGWPRSDPSAGLTSFYALALPADETSRLLFDFFIHYKSRSTYPFAPLCFSYALYDEAVVSIVLASASSVYRQQTGRVGDVDVESKKYLATGLRIVNTRLRDPAYGTSEAVICAIVALTCKDLFEDKFSTWKMHMTGLKSIIDARGGLQSLSSFEMLQMGMLLADMNGALALDSTPLFQSPPSTPDLPPKDHCSSTLASVTMLLSLSEPGVFDATCDALFSVASLSRYINENANEKGFFTDDIIRSARFFPVLSEVLQLERQMEGLDIATTPFRAMKEAIRLTLMLYVALLKERFQIEPSCVEKRSSALSQFLLSGSAMNHDSRFHSLWLWIYATMAISLKGSNRTWVIERISTLTHQMDIQSWFKAASIIRDIAWVDELADEPLTSLGLDSKHSGLGTI